MFMCGLTCTCLWAAPTQETTIEKAPVEHVEKAVPEAQMALPAEERAPDRPEPPSYEGAFLKMVLSLLLLLFVLFFGIWIVRRLSKGRLNMFREPKHIRIIDRRPLSAKTALYLVEVGDKRVLMAESQLEIKALTTIDLTERFKETGQGT